MEKEIDILKSQIPDNVLRNLRTDDVRVLRKIAKSFSFQKKRQIERQQKVRVETPSEKLVKLLKAGIRRGELEIRTFGGTEKVTQSLLNTKTAVSIVCPDFETEELKGKTVYKSGGRIQSGVGTTGKRLLNSLDLINRISELSQGLDFFIIYQASSEEIIDDEDIKNIRKSSIAMQNELIKRNLSFRPHFLVLEDGTFTEQARDMASTINLSNDVIETLSKDREEILKMRLGLLDNSTLGFELKRQEALFDVATHVLSEDFAGKMIGHKDFVHFAVDSSRFSEFYENPAIAIGRNLRYKGD